MTNFDADSIFGYYVPNAEDAKPKYTNTVIPVGVYVARMIKSERQHDKNEVAVEGVRPKCKHYAELVIEEGEQKGKRLFTHNWVFNKDLTASGQPKDKNGQQQFSVIVQEFSKQNSGLIPTHESDLAGYCYTVKVTVSEDKATGEKKNWASFISSSKSMPGRDSGTSPMASEDSSIF